MTGDDLIFIPVKGGRLRGIARQWVRDDAPANVRESLERLAVWMDEYEKMVREELEKAVERE
jgi:hypothetical protein